MSQLRQHDTELTAQGWTILGITAQSADAVAAYTQAQAIRFPILIDANRAVAQDYGVYSLISLEGFQMPHNSTFLIDSGGHIRLVHVGRRSTDVLDEAALLAALAAVES